VTILRTAPRVTLTAGDEPGARRTTLSFSVRTSCSLLQLRSRDGPAPRPRGQSSSIRSCGQPKTTAPGRSTHPGPVAVSTVPLTNTLLTIKGLESGRESFSSNAPLIPILNGEAAPPPVEVGIENRNFLIDSPGQLPVCRSSTAPSPSATDPGRRAAPRSGCVGRLPVPLPSRPMRLPRVPSVISAAMTACRPRHHAHWLIRAWAAEPFLAPPRAATFLARCCDDHLLRAPCDLRSLPRPLPTFLRGNQPLGECLLAHPPSFVPSSR